MIGVGYEGRDLESFMSALRLRGVEVLVDVRLNPLSRKAGFAKRALSERLGREGIEYRHEPALGNPRDNRDGYASVDGAAAATARETYRERLATDAAAAALDRISLDAETRIVGLLCFEADAAHCHREQVLDALARLVTVG